MRALAATAAALTVAVIGPLLLIGALIGGITAVGGAATTAGALDPAKIPPLARELLPRITTITATSCPQLPPLWVVAEIQAESGWNPTAFSADRNGGAAGLYQLDQANWTTAGGQPWRSIPPPAHADVFAPVRHLELAVPFVCTNLRTMAAHLAATAKPTPALDAMLVCHIAGCDRVTRSASGIPAAGEAGCGDAAAPTWSRTTSPPSTATSPTTPRPQAPPTSAPSPHPSHSPERAATAASPTRPPGAASPPRPATPSSRSSPSSARPGPMPCSAR